MIFDNLLLSGILSEMTPLISGGVVQKIKQTHSDEIFIDIHSLGTSHCLFFSLNPILQTQKQNPFQKPLIFV